MACMMEILGLPPKALIDASPRGHLFFDESFVPRSTKNSRGKIRKPGSKHLAYVLRCKDENFIDFLLGCFQWNPEERMTPEEALRHD